VARRRVDLVEILIAQAGRADHVGDPGLRSEPGELDARGRRGEIDNRVGLDEERQRIGDDRKAARGTSRFSPSDSWMVLTTMRPMRPAAPLTISLISAIALP
jgi:hypothetical protein